jgi:hypothetical protein
MPTAHRAQVGLLRRGLCQAPPRPLRPPLHHQARPSPPGAPSPAIPLRHQLSGASVAPAAVAAIAAPLPNPTRALAPCRRRRSSRANSCYSTAPTACRTTHRTGRPAGLIPAVGRSWLAPYAARTIPGGPAGHRATQTWTAYPARHWRPSRLALPGRRPDSVVCVVPAGQLLPASVDPAAGGRAAPPAECGRAACGDSESLLKGSDGVGWEGVVGVAAV